MGSCTSKVHVKIVNATGHCLVLRDSFRMIYGGVFGVVNPSDEAQVVAIKIPSARTYFRVAILVRERNGDEFPTGLHIDVQELLFPEHSFKVVKDADNPKAFHLQDGRGEDLKLGRMVSGERLDYRHASLLYHR